MEYWDIYDEKKQKTGRTMKRNDWNMKPDEYHLTVLGVLKRPDGRYLITQRKLDKEWGAGWWEVPGGGVNVGEDSRDAVIREIREETGLTVTLDTGFRAVVTYSPKPDVMKDVIYFAAEYIGGDARRQVEEVTELCWVPAEEAAAHITFENDKDVLRKYREYCKA